MIIRNVDACWLSVPDPDSSASTSPTSVASPASTWRSCASRSTSGLVGWGEAKAAVGSAGSCAALVSLHHRRARPAARRAGRSPGHAALGGDVQRHPRALRARAGGARFRRSDGAGSNVAAMSGVDMALWDLLGKSLGAPVVDLWGGACRADMPLYASGGWADAAGIGAELNGLRRRAASRAVKMRVGVMDGDVDDERRPGRGGARRARAGHRPDGRRPRHVQRRRGQALRGRRRSLRRAVVRGARQRRRPSRRRGRPRVDQHRRSPPARASSPDSTSAT